MCSCVVSERMGRDSMRCVCRVDRTVDNIRADIVSRLRLQPCAEVRPSDCLMLLLLDLANLEKRSRKLPH